MTADAPPTLLARIARRPAPVLIGLAVGFLGCCIAGRVAARQQTIKNFARFHQGIAPDAHFYPTYSLTLNIARQHVRPGTTLVIVSGDSVLHGVGQRPGHVWTLHLQQLLGPDYVVLNLATRAGVPQEFGGLVADQLTAEGVPVVLVCRGNLFDWDGLTYRYFFWDAWGKGYVQPDPRRDAWAADFTATYAKDEKSSELRRRGRIDGATYAADLWNKVAYKYRATVWTPLKYPNFWRPHRDAVDTEPGPTFPYDSLRNPAPDSQELSILRQFTAAPVSQAVLRGEQADVIGEMYTRHVPDRLRARGLYVFRLENPYYRSRLTDDERIQHEEVHRRFRDSLIRAGHPAQLVGERYTDRDYIDLTHLSESGGRKLAEDLAPTIRAMSARLYGAKPAAPEGGKP